MNTTKITNKEILEAIGTEYSKNNCVLFQTSEGVVAAPISAVIEQPYQDILLSLGRGFSEMYALASQADNNLNGIYSGANKTRFINDLAASTIIMALKNKIDELNKEIENNKKYIVQLEKDISWEMYKNN